MNYRLKSLADQVIVITGASSGIGLVTARLAALATFAGWRSLSKENGGAASEKGMSTYA